MAPTKLELMRKFHLFVVVLFNVPCLQIEVQKRDLI